jgi:hemoglobin
MVNADYGMLKRYCKYLFGGAMTPTATPANPAAAVAAARERRSAMTAEITARTGIDEAMIERLVRTFYEQVRADPTLGPIFEARITDCETHIGRMCAFWSSVALMTGVYHGRPMEKHLTFPIDARHFDQWLALFRRTAREVCPPAAADHFIELAGRIAESLELGIAMQDKVLLMKGQRLIRPDHAVFLPKEAQPKEAVA